MIANLFEKQVALQPECVAVHSENKILTYGELDRYAGRIAAHVKRSRCGGKVGLLFRGGCEMVAAMFGTLKARRTYVPLSTQYPRPRLEYMLSHSGCDLVLTDRASAPLTQEVCDRLSIPYLVAEELDHEPMDGVVATSPEAAAGDLAYIIYTSGSTGTPKAVMQTHGNVAALGRVWKQEFAIGPNDRATLFSSFSHDGAVCDIFGTLLNGGALYVPPSLKEADIYQLRDFLIERKITIYHSVPSLFRYLAASFRTNEAFPSLRLVLLGGEKLGKRDVEAFMRMGTSGAMVNLYGQSEHSLTSRAVVTAPAEAYKPIIGDPMTGASVFLVDENGTEVDPLRIGEILVCGPFISPGYYNGSEKDNSNFADDEEFGRMYWTGDLGRLLVDGSIEFVGRKDSQVKIRGFRVELEEIESRLAAHASVQDAAVKCFPTEDGEAYLCAYVALESGKEEPSERELKEWTAIELPDYMVPSRVVSLESLPHTASGKIDREALKEPGIDTGTVYVAPGDSLEQTLARIWGQVLKTERPIGVEHDFFELGGHSLKAMMMTGKVQKELGVDIPLSLVFKIPTIKQLAQFIRERGGNDFIAVGTAEEKDYYPLSSGQKRLYLIYQLNPDSTAYNLPFAVELGGRLDRGKLERAFIALIQRHEILRTAITLRDGVPVQQVVENPPFAVEFQEGDGADTDWPRPFDLSQPPLMRVSLREITEDRHLLRVDIHHIAADGTSLQVLMEEFVALYSGETLPPRQLQYKDFAQWQHDRLADGSLERQRDYWRNRFEDGAPKLELYTDFPRPAVFDHAGGTVRLDCPPDVAAALNTFGEKNGTTLYMTLLTVLSALLHRYTGQEDIVVGSPTSGRHHADLDRMIGFLLGTVPMRLFPAAGKTLGLLLEEAKAEALSSFENQDYPFREILQDAGYELDRSRNPLFDVMLIVQNYERQQRTLGRLTVASRPVEKRVAKVDLTLTAYPADSRLTLEFEYCSRLFKKETVQRLGGHFMNLLRVLVSEPRSLDTPLRAIEYLDAAEKAMVLETFSKGPEAAIEFAPAHTGILRLAEEWPHRVCAVASRDNAMLTYGEMARRSLNVAAYLAGLGSGTGSVVALMVEPSLEMAVGILGILSAGAAYLPLPPDAPAARLEYCLEDCRPAERLTNEDLLAIGAKAQSRKGAVEINGEDLAYVIYTSGSTGKPKGVLTQHSCLSAYLHAFAAQFPMRDDDVVLQQASVAFDAFVEEFYPVLSRGGRLAIPARDEIQDVELLSDFIAKHGVTFVDCSPLLLSELNRVYDAETMGWVHTFISGGDVLKKHYIEELLAGSRVFNTYGPTETTVCALYHQCGPEDEEDVPIGNPILNYRVYILDRHLQPVPVGVLGELCVAGPGVARGYLNRPDMSAAKFPVAPFDNNLRIYRTGDLAVWSPEGDVRFIGRVDQQVNIRGFRVELGEIEHHVTACDGVREAAVVAFEQVGRGQALCAYIVADSPDIGAIRQQLASFLPPYMIPQTFVPLDNLPLNHAGKVDKKQLPPPDALAAAPYRAPSSDIEIVLAGIWRDFFRLPEERKIGVDDDYFELGGDSILANRIMARVRETFNVDLSLKTLFESPTIAELALKVQEAESRSVGIPRASRDREIPLSFAQERLWFLKNLDGGNVSYHVPRVVRFRGNLRIDVLEKTFSEIVFRHEILRTVFPTVGDRPLQKILPSEPVKIPILSFEHLEGEEQEQEFRQWLRSEGQKTFDLEAGPLFRLTLLKLAADEHLLVLTEHHLVHDGWTQGVLLREFVTLYDAFWHGLPSPLPPLPIQYADYAVWQREYLQGEVLNNHLDYWRTKLAGVPPYLDLPLDHPRPDVISGRGAARAMRIPADDMAVIREFCQRNEVTLFMVMMAVFKILLFRYSNETDICAGTGVANRRFKEMEGMLGMVINTLPLRTIIAPEQSFAEVLAAVKRTCLEAYDHEDVPFEKIVEAVKPERSLRYTPLFQFMFTFMDTPSHEFVLPDLDIGQVPAHNRSAKFDLNVIAIVPREIAGGVNVIWEYNSDIFEESTSERMLAHFRRLLDAALQKPETAVAILPMVTDEEQERILQHWNDSTADYPGERRVDCLVWEQCRRASAAIAVTEGKRELSYEMLQRQAGCFARYLKEKGVRAHDRVAVLMPRCLEIFPVILGVLSVGAAYVPLDESYPAERIDYICRDCSVQLTVTTADLDFDGPSVDEVEEERSSALAYVMYTSGSTGRPKGVAVEHRGLVNYLTWAAGMYVRGEAVDFPLYSSLGFDLTVTSLYLPLLTGNKVHVYPEAGDGPAILRVLADNRVHVLKLTPSHLKMISPDHLNHCVVKRLIVGGEQFKPALAQKIHEMFPGNIEIYNEYGPTETVVGCTVYRYDPETSNHRSVLVGRPAANACVYVLDPALRLVPDGVLGEIYVSGDGVARGYINNPELSRESFLDDPFKEGCRMYRTGDLGRWTADGDLEFCGRVDRQVKVRGHRIELSEIEQRLSLYPGVGEAAVAVRSDRFGEHFLCAYWTQAKDNGRMETPESRLRTFLAGTLPEYMIPQYFVLLEALPLTVNGKLDEAALPEPEKPIAQNSYAAPRSSIERTIVDIWSEILAIPPDAIGIDHNFFELGGHSLRATLFVSRVKRILKADIPLGVVFQRPTVRQLAAFVEGREAVDAPDITVVEKRDYYPVSPAQLRMYIAHQLRPLDTGYNTTYMFRLRGSLDMARLQEAVDRIVRRHSSFRTSFLQMDGDVVQRIHGDEVVEVRLEDVPEETMAPAVDRFIRPFDLSCPPLLRIQVCRLEETNFVVLLDMHHIISDGFSFKILFEEFQAFYSGGTLPEPPLQYVDFAVWQEDYFRVHPLEKQKDYWLDVFSGSVPQLAMPTDFDRAAAQKRGGEFFFFSLEPELSERVKEMASQKGVTLFMLLKAAFVVLLSKYSGQEDIVVGTPLIGRSHPDLERTVGMFVNTLALRTFPRRDRTFDGFLAEVKELALAGYDHQDFQIQDLIDALDVKVAVGRHPLFDVVFAMHNIDGPQGGGSAEGNMDGALSFAPYEYKKRAIPYDLILYAFETKLGLGFKLLYATHLFHRQTMEGLADHFRQVLSAVVETPDITLGEIEVDHCLSDASGAIPDMAFDF